MRIIFSLLLAAVICVVPGAAQFETAVVLGTVHDPSGNPVSDVAVKLTNVGTGIVSETKTDETGDYLFQNVKVGTYTVGAAKVGFSNENAENVPVRVNARQRVDFDLRVGQVSETIQVTDGIIAVEADSSDRGLSVSNRQVVDLPLNGRNYSDLALLSTGVRRSDYAYANPPREGAFNVNGQRSVFNNFLMDGVDNNAYGTSNQGFSNQVVQLVPDAVAEFKVVTSNPSAEYGRASGAVINATMKSGTNSFHGTAWEYLRNTDLNAIGFFRPPAGKPILQRNQFGFTVGGPIVKNRAFFFGDWEGFRERQKQVATATLPTAAQRQGIFPTSITNPLTGITYPANTPLPAGAITPFAAKVLADLPLPNPNPGEASTLFRNTLANKNNTDKIDLKLDGQLNSKVTAFARASHRKQNFFNGPLLPGQSGGDGNGFIRSLTQQIVLGATWTVTPNSLLEVRYGQSRTLAGKAPPYVGGPDMQTVYGIPGLPTDPRLTGGLTPQNVTGFSAFGRQATNPQWQYPDVYNPKVNFSTIRGRHALKAGFEYQRVYTEVQDVNPLYGQDFYQGTAANGFTGQPLADFMFGLRSEYQQVNFFIAHYAQAMKFAYIQDDYKVSRKLTLNLGMRYEYATPMWERDLKLSNFDPTTNKLIPAKDGSIADRAQVNPDRNNFGPRVGLAYSLDNKTVIRSGYGISYVHFNRAGGGNLLAINGPQVVNGDIIQKPSDPGFRTTQQGYASDFTDPSKFDPLKATVTYLPRDTPTPMIQNWSFSIQRELPGKFIADVGYVGNNSAHLIIFADFNEARPLTPAEAAPGAIASAPSVQARRPNQAFSAQTVAFPWARSNYHSLQARLERRFANGFSILNSFVWSKAIDTTGQALEAQNGSGGRSSPQSFYNLKAERAVSDFDQPFNNVTSMLLEIPVGKGRRFGKDFHPAVNAVIGGWQLSAINTAGSGQPINLTYNPPSANQVSITNPDWKGGISYRPNVLGPVMVDSSTRRFDNWLNIANVVAPAASAGSPFGNAGRNIARRPGFTQLDLGVQKSFPLPREGAAVSFRMEAFNLFNHTNFGNPGINISSPATFGKITSTPFPARQIQFALRLSF